MLKTGAWLQNCGWDNKIGADHDALLGVKAKTVGTELSSIWVTGGGESAEVLGVFSDDIVIDIHFDDTTGR